MIEPSKSRQGPRLTLGIPQLWLNFIIMTEFHKFKWISQFKLNFAVSTEFHNYDWISQFKLNFTISTEFHNFNPLPKASGLGNLTIQIQIIIMVIWINSYCNVKVEKIFFLELVTTLKYSMSGVGLQHPVKRCGQAY